MTENKNIFVVRDRLRRSIRSFFEARQYLEVDTPIGVYSPGTEVYLNYFETRWQDHQGKSHTLYLRSSPELHMKRIIASGVDRVFQMAPCFRNVGEYSPWHHPEFTMLEWYQKELSYKGMIEETSSLLQSTAEDLASITKVAPETILPETFERVRVFDVFEELTGIPLIDQDPDLAKKGKAKAMLSMTGHEDFDTAFFKILIEKIEPYLAAKKGCILMDYPPSQAALAVVKDGVAQRFEFYLGRVELCNGFYELTGEQNNRTRIKESLDLREKVGMPPHPEDELFYEDMRYFNANCSGNALGFDRWAALLLGGQSLDEVIGFRRDYRRHFGVS